MPLVELEMPLEYLQSLIGFNVFSGLSGVSVFHHQVELPLISQIEIHVLVTSPVLWPFAFLRMVIKQSGHPLLLLQDLFENIYFPLSMGVKDLLPVIRGCGAGDDHAPPLHLHPPQIPKEPLEHLPCSRILCLGLLLMLLRHDK